MLEIKYNYFEKEEKRQEEEKKLRERMKNFSKKRKFN